jgi:hypothetical protein
MVWIVKLEASRELSLHSVHAALVVRFCEKAPAYASMMNWLRRLHFSEDIFEPGIQSGKLSDDLVGFKILMKLTVFPFHSVRTLVRTLKIPRSATWDHLQKGPFVAKHVRWVSHRPNDITRRGLVTTAESLFQDLRQARHQGWRSFERMMSRGSFISWIMNKSGFLREWHHNLTQGWWPPPQKSWFRYLVPTRFPDNYRVSAKNQIHRCLFLQWHHSQDHERNAIWPGKFAPTRDVAHG